MSAPALADPAPQSTGISAALVVGASGYVGRAVVAELRRQQIPTVAHVRFDSDRLEHWRARFASLGAECAATAWDRQAFTELIDARAVSHVFLCLGTTLRRTLRKSNSAVADSYQTVDYALSALLVDACARSAGRVQVVLISAAGANATSRNKYLAVRGRLEEYLQASGLDFTIARPGYVTGPGRDEFRPLERLGAALTDWALLWGAVLGMQRLRERYRSIGAQELAKALVSHAQDPHSRGKLLPGERLRDFP